ncbi:MAG: Asp-tRNA(Asn)/Glu-tRNA(Gln) amidotransferase subunit GatC [Blastocatellia bacterium]
MPITREEVTKIATLSHLELTPEETESFTVQLSAIVNYIDQLNELDTSAVSPWRQRGAGDIESSYAAREDVTEPSFGAAKAVEQAPDPANGYFRVPKVIGG